MKLHFFQTATLILLFLGCQSEKQKLAYAIHRSVSTSEFNGFAYVEFRGDTLFLDTLKGSLQSLPIPDIYTPVPLASVSKLLTKLVVLKLAEEGKLSLDATLSTYRKDFTPSIGDSITIRQLLDMTAGLPRELTLPKTRAGVILNDKNLAGPFLDTISTVSLISTPGTQKAYSNLGYWLLGSVVEAVLQMPVDEAYTRYLYQPLGLHHTGYYHRQRVLPSFRHSNGRWVLDTLNIAARYTSGGFYSCVHDLVKIAHALKGESYLSHNSKVNLFGNKKALIEIYGTLPAVTNMLILDYENELFVVVLNNVGFQNPNEIINLKNIIYNELNLHSSSTSSPKTIKVAPISALSDSLKIERAMKAWVHAIMQGDEHGIYQGYVSITADSATSLGDPTWKELARLPFTMKGLEPAGFRYVTEGHPQGLEVWFQCDGPQKIALLWITEDPYPQKVQGLFIKPDDMTWLGKNY